MVLQFFPASLYAQPVIPVGSEEKNPVLAGRPSKKPEELYYSLQVKGAENAGILPDDITQIETISDTLSSYMESAFVGAAAAGNLSSFAGDTSQKKLFSGLPSPADTGLKKLDPPIYAAFSDRNMVGGKAIVLCASARRLSNTAYAKSGILKISAAQWVKEGKDVRLVFYVEPVQ